MPNKICRFFFPFRGKVKTQLKITPKRDGTIGLVKPADVKHFENAVRTILSSTFPEELRPIHGYIEFTLNHYTMYKRTKDGLLSPEKEMDCDNLLKAVQDCFQPLKKKVTKLGKDGQPIFTKKGNLSYEWVVIEKGVISDDKFVYRASSNWIPVENKKDEGIEVFIRLITEEELRKPVIPNGEVRTFELK